MPSVETLAVVYPFRPDGDTVTLYIVTAHNCHRDRQGWSSSKNPSLLDKINTYLTRPQADLKEKLISAGRFAASLESKHHHSSDYVSTELMPYSSYTDTGRGHSDRVRLCLNGYPLRQSSQRPSFFLVKPPAGSPYLQSTQAHDLYPSSLEYSVAEPSRERAAHLLDSRTSNTWYLSP